MYMNNIIPAELFPWVSYPGSFMQRLKLHGVKNAQIRIVHEGWQFLGLSEREVLSLPQRAYAWVREVIIYSDQIIWMYARTVIPLRTLTGKERELRNLNTRSLGSILFKYPDLMRSEFEFFSVTAEMDLYKKIKAEVPVMPYALSARNSIFTVRNKKLLLTEVFFPKIAELVMES